MSLFIFNAASIIVLIGLIGISLLNFIKEIPNKTYAIYLMLYGLIVANFYIYITNIDITNIDITNPISILGIIIIITIYSIYVILYIYMLDIIKFHEMDQIIKLHEEMKLDVICVKAGYSIFTNIFVVVVVAYSVRYIGFNSYEYYILFILISVCMLIECLFLAISLIRICYKTEFKLPIFKQFFLLSFLIIICVLAFAILNTSLNCIDITSKKVIVQDDHFIDYIYQYACIFTLQYSSSDNLSHIDKVLNIIALIYSYTFVTTIISLTINSFSNKKDSEKYIPKCPICGSKNINKITQIRKMIKATAFGTMGAIDDAGKTYECENCGSKF